MLDKILEVSALVKETTGAVFSISQFEDGRFKMIPVRTNNFKASAKGLKMYQAKEFELMIDDAIAFIKANRIKDTSFHARKPYTLFKI